MHLHRCAGFRAPWNVLERDLRDGVGPSVDRLLQGRSREGTVPADFAELSAMAAEAAITANDPDRLKAWWIYRMLFGPDPLGERLTLDVAQPLRHQQCQGPRPVAHAPAERDVPRSMRAAGSPICSKPPFATRRS